MKKVVLIILVTYIYAAKPLSVFANSEYTVNKNIIEISIQNKKIVIDEEVELININTDTSGIEWRLLNNNNKIKIISAFSNKKILIPHRLNDSTLLIGDLNRKNTETLVFNIKYLINNPDNNIVLNIDTSRKNIEIRLKTNNIVESVNCDNETNYIRPETDKVLNINCLSQLRINTVSKKSVFLYIKDWLSSLNFKNIFKN